MARETSETGGRRVFRAVHGLTAWAGMLVGLPLATLGGMAAVGTFVDNGWLRLLVPTVVLIAVPALLADRLLPADADKRRPGLVRDVLSGSWMAAALATSVLAGGVLGSPLRVEAERLEQAERPRASQLSRWLAGPAPRETLAAADRPEALESAAPSTPKAHEKATEEAPTLDETEIEPAAATPEPAPNAEADVEADAEPEADAPEDPKIDGNPSYTPAELFQRYAPAVVALTVTPEDPLGMFGGKSSGTGFFIDDRGTLATNHHVVEGAGRIEVELIDGTTIDSVELLTSDPEVDLALLRIDPKQVPESVALTVTTLGDSEAVAVGEPVSVIGNPLGLDHTLTTGVVSARRIYEGERYIQMSAPISPGNSGGPVFDTHGQVIGVSVAGLIGGQNLNLAVPVSQLSELIAADDRYPERRTFGAKSW